VCLDSLYRVVTGTLTSFVVDEAVAVFPALQPTQMVKRTQNSWLMETPVTQAKTTYLVDAWMRPSSRTSDHFCAIKSCAPIWIRNRYARRPRDHHVRRPSEASSAGVFVHAAATKVLDPASRGKKVVLLEHQEVHGGPGEFISERQPDARVKVYNAGTGSGPSERRPGVDQVRSARLAPASLRCRSSSSTSTVPRRVPRQLPVHAGVRRASSSSSESVSSATDAPVCAQRTPWVPSGEGDRRASDGRPVLASKHFVTNQLTFEAQVRF
jgi:hypothetical protein